MTSACPTRFGRMLVLSTALASVVCGCAGGGTNTTSPATPTPPAPTVSSVTVVGAADNLTVGQTAQFSATANYSDGTFHGCTATATWQSSDSPVATVTTSGLVTATGAGGADITATYVGKAATSRVTVTAVGRDTLTIQSLDVLGPFVVGARLSFSVTVAYSLVSAPSGRVGLQISDQTGKLLGSNPSVDVASGTGKTATLTDEITVPAGTTRVCADSTMDLPSGQRLNAPGGCGTIR